MMFGRWENLERKTDGILDFFFLKMNLREWKGFKRRREREFLGQSEVATSPIPVGGVWATWDQRGPLAVGPTAPTRLGQCGLWPRSPLKRSLTFFSRILGIQTPISNPFLDYKPWLPHARQRLHNFEKWLRNHLRKWRWSQLNEWEQKVA